MQAASSPYLPPYYQGLYHIQPLGSHQDYELKRQYLALLSPQQIIEICLTFDVHVSPYVKSTVWPQDLNAAIAGLRKSTTAGATTVNDGKGDASSSPSLASPRKDGGDSARQEPVMASLDRPPPEESGRRVEGSGERMEERGAEKPLEENVSGTSSTTTTAAVTATASGSTQTSTTSAVASTSTSTTPVPTSSTPAPPPQQQQQSPYPHQPYGYPQHAAAAYPHAPYYPPPPGYPGYPASSYPHYPQPLPNGYPTAPGSYPNPYSAPPPPAPAPAPTHPQSSSAIHYPPLHPPHPHHQDQAQDDLPSYEEMIVEALQEAGSAGAAADLEGCAPKDLFSWMAARYPLQSNFRPSASQALQKAFKRGRLEKSSSGKYRLNGAWEGGSTSRRTTRRPQSQSNVPLPPASSTSTSHLQPPPSGSPFTHAPLIHHHHHANSQQQHSSGYPYAYGYPGYPQHPAQQQQLQQLQLQQSMDTKSTTTGDKTTGAAMLDDSDRDAYEAAQNILKAINFGDLLQIAQNEEDDNKKLATSFSGGVGRDGAGGGGGGGEVSMDQLTSLLIQAQHAISSQQQQSMEGQQPQQPQQQQQQAVTGGIRANSISALASTTTPLPTLSATAGVAVASTLTSTSYVAGSSSTAVRVNVRAELQAQLALLAVQLAELGGQECENGGGAPGGSGTVVAQLLQQSQNGVGIVDVVSLQRSGDVGRREEGVGGRSISMAVLGSGEGSSSSSLPLQQPFMNGLLPLSLNLGVNSNPSSGGSVSGSSGFASKTMPSSTQSRPLVGNDDDDIPIDPVLRDASVVSPVVVTSPPPPLRMTSTVTEVDDESGESRPPVDSRKITGSGGVVSDVSDDTDAAMTVVSALSVNGRLEEGRQRLAVGVSGVVVGGGAGDEEEDSDDDMEEII